MKQITLIPLVFLFSCAISLRSQESSNFTAIKKEEVFLTEINNHGYELKNGYYIYMSTDEMDSCSGEWNRNLIFSRAGNNGIVQKLASVDLSDGHYSDEILFFEDKSSDKQVILWKKEGEYWSYVDIFLFTGETIRFLTDIAVGVDCCSCDSHNLPEKLINVSESQGNLEVLFNGDVIYRGSENHKVPYHTVSISAINLRVIYKNDNASIVY